MAASILDNFGQLIDQGYASKAAERLGESPQNVFRGLQAGSSSILAGLANKTGDSAMMRQVFDLVSSPNDSIREIDPAAYAEEAETGKGLGSVSGNFLSNLFGNRASMVNDVVARSSGLGLSSVSTIMRFAAPLVLGFLGRHVKANGLDQASFTRVLSDERPNIMRAAPAGLASALGVDASREREVPIEGVRTTPEYVTHRERTPQKRGGSRWLWPTVAALAVIALFWGARSRSHRAPIVDTMSSAAGTVAPSTVGPSTVAPSTVAPESSMASTTPAIPSGGSITLPNGTVLNVPAGGFESRLFGFIGNPSQPANANTWFAFDRINFANNSATLTPDSQDQLTNVATILKAYPHASVKIGGFTDNVGNVADNKRLSAQRAAAVRAALMQAGIPASRVQAQGYGEEHPIADNSTEAGRAQNRRIGILILHK
jgi:OmpA-OmpF porin, OOP family